MTQLDEHIERVERYGLVRDVFPVPYNGHTLKILTNDAHFDDGRLVFDFLLYCTDCAAEHGVSGRFSAEDDEQVSHVANARVAVFSGFQDTECL